jgi:hypothetical protein
MSPARRWNLADVATVLDAPAASTAALRQALPRRRPSEIEALRASLHAYHQPPGSPPPATPYAVLTEPICRLLSQRRGSLVCPLCGATF